MNVLKLLGANATGAGGQTLAFRSSATSGNTAGTIVAPSDIVAGDLLVLYDNAANNTTLPTAVTPSGWDTALINQTFSTNRRCMVHKKIANGTEAGATITGMSVNNVVLKILLVISTNGASSSTAYSIASEATNNDPTAQVISSASGNSPLAVFGFIRNQTGTGNSMSPTQDGIITSAPHYGYYKLYNSSPADVTFDTGDGGLNNFLMSFYIEVD